MLITIKQLDEDIKRAQTLLADIPQGTEKAIINAANRAIQSARTAGNKEMRKIYVGMKAGDINSRVKINKAGGGRLMASFISKGRVMRLINFKSRITKSGVFAQVKKGSGGVIKKSFYGTANTGLSIFIRKKKTRYPLEMLHGPSMPQMLSNTQVSDAINDRGAEVFETRLAHEVERLLNK